MSAAARRICPPADLAPVQNFPRLAPETDACREKATYGCSTLPMASSVQRVLDMKTHVCDVMSWSSLTMPPDCQASTALTTLVEAEADVLFVVNERHEFLGLLTDYELLKADLNGSLHDCSVAQLMQRHPLSLTPEQTLADAARLFRDGSVTHLPVIREGRLLGMIQRRDVLRWMQTQRSEPTESIVPSPKYLGVPSLSLDRSTVC